ncbi:sensor histidine kinase [Roseimarinus sediminis]|uniref:sensor histidine kinase n=1 Tax=Roseimarinus sediminis TaxID=1610899 RepID=UPI003D194425
MENKQLQFISQLSSYQPKSILFRLVTVSLVALLFMFIADTIVGGDTMTIPLAQYIKVVIIFNIISEINVLTDNLAERYFPIPSKVVLRALLHLLLSLLIGFLAIVYFQHQLKAVDVINQPITWLMFAFGFVFIFILIVIAISLRITARWISAQKEVEALRQVQLMNDYNALQDQLNPHFLFNNLSVLKSMIQYDTQAAVAFTQNFTDSYRYVLQCKDKTTVQLKDELEFIKAYISLHKERLGSGLQVEIDIDKELLNSAIPPLSLQLLVENAIKHNIVGKNKALNIRIFTQKRSLVIENNLQPKESTYSSHNGLKNLVSRYALISEQQVVIKQNDEQFSVEIPLL